MMLTGISLNVTSATAFQINFSIKDPGNPRQYWGGVATDNAALVKFMNKDSGDVKKAVAEIIAGLLLQAGSPYTGR